MHIDAALKDVARLGVDTAPFIYYIEENPTYLARVAPIFQAADAAQIELVTSTITVSEVLIHPLRLGADNLRDEYLDLFLNSANLEIQSIDIEVAQRAAELRAVHNIRLPDACRLQRPCTPVVLHSSRMTGNSVEWTTCVSWSWTISIPIECGSVL